MGIGYWEPMGGHARSTLAQAPRPPNSSGQRAGFQGALVMEKRRARPLQGAARMPGLPADEKSGKEFCVHLGSSPAKFLLVGSSPNWIASQNIACRKLAQIRSIHIHSPDFWRTTSIRYKCNLRPIRRPCRVNVPGAAIR